MESILEKSSERARALLFGLLVNCVFLTGAEEDCPLSEKRNNLSLEENINMWWDWILKKLKAFCAYMKNAMNKDFKLDAEFI